MPIKVLAPEVVSKIAAGEVVERPASVVKELIDNSLDAGATQIAIEVRGVSLIRVVDNGSGIPADEVELAFHRYATSKIDTIADLDAISSLGFRGEALPSIAAVAQVEVLTRTRDEIAGTYINLKNGAVVEKGKRGCPQGTSVTVRHLFQNVPARLKFLKSPATENSHISNLVSQYSLAFPEVRFSLSIDGRLILQTSGSGQLRDVLVKVYGMETAEAMIPVEGSQIWGFVSRPSVARSSRSYLSFFVNRRWVNSRLLSRAVEDAYRGLLMTGRHPIAVLNISLPYQDVDVNVHPAKTEVRFRDEQRLFSAVQRAVRAALVEEMTVPVVSRQPSPVATPTSLPEGHPVARQERLLDSLPSAEPSSKSALPILRVLGQLFSTYIIAEGPDGLYLIDQHAAHERILFERIRAQRAARKVEVQGMLEPLSIEVTPRQEEVMKASGEVLASYGFAIEPFGPRTYLLRTVPAMIKGDRAVEVVVEMLDSIGGGGNSAGWEEKIAQSLACHSAVRAGQILSLEEMQQLVRELESTEWPHSCPHGRPTMIRFSSSQLDKEFGRSS